mgnify:CR=1 FL=1|tara:strand:- start:867 stop:1253 length:387 start_codon:yes stop_codon:yes gene_type:complete
MDFDIYQAKLKELFIPYLIKVIPEVAYKNSQALTKEMYADTIYTDIMALGYNFGDINKASDDKAELTITLPGIKTKSMGEFRNEIQETAKHYSDAVSIFSQAHLNVQSGKSPLSTLDYIEVELNKLTA